MTVDQCETVRSLSCSTSRTIPDEEHPMAGEAIEQRTTVLMVTLMKENDAPRERYQRLGL